jgi:hypothetical protein
LAAAAGIEDPDSFSHQWHILMKGAIMAAEEGDIHAAERARELVFCCLSVTASRSETCLRGRVGLKRFALALGV